MIGTTLSHFKITAKLGQGGMGEVYRAEDTQLGRQVAIKLLPAEMANDRERLERFQREARSLAALDHPNIVPLHSVEVVGGEHLLVMGLIEGSTLDELIPERGMPLEQFLETAIPIADALVAAHAKGITHRDLKPSNVMVGDDGRVRVLDFGLAKLVEETKDPELTQLPTEALTEQGIIMGTVPYMSPEQIEGKPVDSRTDIFSLGVLLYEMATGKRPFEGDSLSICLPWARRRRGLHRNRRIYFGMLEAGCSGSTPRRTTMNWIVSRQLPTRRFTPASSISRRRSTSVCRTGPIVGSACCSSLPTSTTCKVTWKPSRSCVRASMVASTTNRRIRADLSATS